MFAMHCKWFWVVCLSWPTQCVCAWASSGPQAPVMWALMKSLLYLVLLALWRTAYCWQLKMTCLGKRCKYSPRKISPEKLTPCYEVPPARCTPCRGRLRSYAKPKNASQLGSQTIFVPKFNRQRIRQSGWNSRSLDKNQFIESLRRLTFFLDSYYFFL